MPINARLYRPNLLIRQVLILLALAAITTIGTIHLSPYLSALLKIPPSITLPSPEIQNILNGKHKIVTLGDSITAAAKYTGGYVWLMQRYLNTLYPHQKIEIINAGISGNKSTDMQQRFQHDVVEQKPDLVTINVGVNDVLHSFLEFNNQKIDTQSNFPKNVTLEVYRQKLTEMVKAAQGEGIKVALLSPTPIREALDSPENLLLPQYIAAMRQVAIDYKCIYIDLNSPFREVMMNFQKHGGRSFNLLTTDGIHPNQAGNRIIAYTVLRGLGISAQDIQSVQVKY